MVIALRMPTAATKRINSLSLEEITWNIFASYIFFFYSFVSLHLFADVALKHDMPLVRT